MARVRDLLAVQRTVSFEFFPPKTDRGRVQLTRTLDEIEALDPDFVSVTYGAAGSERGRTFDLVVEIERERGTSTVAHLTCVGHTRAEVDALCNRYADAGVENLLALRGDPPTSGSSPLGQFRFADELVEHLQADGRFSVGVAAHPEGHPESPDLASDRRRLAAKLDKADFAITQFFFEAENYLSLVDDLEANGCRKPVIPGIIPITNAAQVGRFADLAGASLPAWLTERIARAEGDDVAKIGIEIATELGSRLLAEGAPGVHLYTLNKSDAAAAVAAELRTVVG